MEALWEKLGVIVAAIISALGGLYIHDRNIVNKRFAKIENDVIKNKMDIAVIEVKFSELKSDTEEIKKSQLAIIDLLTKRRR